MTGNTNVYDVPDISCDHCKNAIETALDAIDGVASVTVDVDAKTVSVTGTADGDTVVAGIDEAGYKVA